MSVAAAFDAQALACGRLGSAFTARLCALASARLTDQTPIGALLLNWPGDAANTADSVPLRFCGALHRLVLQGDAGLAPHWPPNIPGSDDALWAAVEEAMLREETQLRAWLQSAPQTNEVRRAAALIPGLHMVAAHLRTPLALFELGASAGLNLLADRFALTAGPTAYGPRAPILSLSPDWTGPAPPPMAELIIAQRRGVDLAPIDPGVPEDRERLLSYLWPDQPERRQRTERALAEAARLGLRPDAGDAGAWLVAALPGTPANATAVVYHTIAWQYFPEPTRKAALKAMEDHAQTRPLARIAMEADGDQTGAALTLTLWPRGRRITLGRADFHGRWVDWTGPSAI